MKLLKEEDELPNYILIFFQKFKNEFFLLNIKIIASANKKSLSLIIKKSILPKVVIDGALNYQK
jgi:hypothetical protein